MLSLENSSSPFLQDSGPCTVLSSFTDDFLCDVGTEPDLSLAIEMIEAEERYTCDNKSTSPMHTNDVDLSDLVDIISQSYKKFPLSHDVPASDTLLDADDLLENNDFLTDLSNDEILSDSYSSCESPELICIKPSINEVRQEIKKIPEEERPSKKYPHILSTLQGTYKGLPQVNVQSPLPQSYTHIMQKTHTLGVIQSVTQHGSQQVARPVTQVNVPIAPQVPVTVQSNCIKVAVPSSVPMPVHYTRPTQINQASRVITVSRPSTRISSPVSVSHTITPTHVPQASVPSLPPPITEPKRYIVLPQMSNGQTTQQRTVQLAQHVTLPQQKTVIAQQTKQVVAKPVNTSVPVHTNLSPVPSPSCDTFASSMDEDEFMHIPKTVCSKVKSEPMVPVVVKQEEDIKSSQSVSTTFSPKLS